MDEMQTLPGSEETTAYFPGALPGDPVKAASDDDDDDVTPVPPKTGKGLTPPPQDETEETESQGDSL